MSKSSEIDKLQVTMLEAEKRSKEVVDIKTDNYFSDGLYGRLMTVGAGVTVIGKRHKTNHLSILLEGTVTISSKYGVATYTAPYIVHTLAGDKRAFQALTKVKYMTLHVTDETDIDKIGLAITEEEL